VNRDDILAFANRGWGLLAEAKTRSWKERKHGLSPGQMLDLGDELRQHARAIRPDWPSPSEREDDLAVHVRVSEALRAVANRAV
jgi:hypothetical protein